ncbi:MAG TPA: 1-(5-phosphoribosyl)-5-[(5-phosphoribosylamino)methylideneamino]imidazole-4-carboxamide isomerase, partial [Acidocella sp.]|nr:1-(5-phosphoribosyl)-5-[(5-phosphoribosylamino)methylideneamino]imidazole-4-carboxamide isomerase [Acidocella sp.]
MTLTLYPAIDLKDGACVRLQRGEMDQATVYATDPGAQAARWQTVGFSWVHVVDLNGAFAGKPVNEDAVRAILASVSVPVQLGGGIRSIAQIETWLAAGITRVILGSAAAKNPELVFEAGKKFPGHIAVGIDAKSGMVATEGWSQTSTLTATEIAKHLEDSGITAIIYTDIARDGMLSGLNLEATEALAATVAINVIASGGVAGVEDIVRLRE